MAKAGQLNNPFPIPPNILPSMLIDKNKYTLLYVSYPINKAAPNPVKIMPTSIAFFLIP